MTPRKIALGLYLPAQPPIGPLRQLVRAARLLRLESILVSDHLQSFIPQALWTEDNTWLASQAPTPHEFFDFQVLLGCLAAHAGNLRLGVGVTEVVRRHPVVIAQTMLTLAHASHRPPILGVGAGERENTEPYGLYEPRPVSRLEEALQIIRLCFRSQGPLHFTGNPSNWRAVS